MNKKVHSVGIIDNKMPATRPFGLRQLDLDFLAVTFGGEAFFMLEKEGILHEIKPVTFVYVPAGERHIYDPEIDSEWQNYGILFDGGAARQAFGKLMPESGIIPVKNISAFRRCWEKLSLSTLDDSETGDEYSFCMLHNILLELRLQSKELLKNQPPPDIREAISFMRNNFRDPEPDFKCLAQKYGICVDSLRKRFKRETGISLHQYFIQLKINTAKSMLSSVNCNISDLAGFLGFDDQYYFSRLFKKKTGSSPLKYRNNLISRGQS